MANMRAIRNRIKSVESTRQITKSMKMVAASKLRKTQESGSSLRVFAAKSGEMLSDIIAVGGETANPFLMKRENRQRKCYVLFVGNRGLCGTYNNSVLRYLEELAAQDEAEAFLVVVGRWGREMIAHSGIEVRRTFDEMGDAPDSSDARQISEYLKELYLNGEADEIVLVFQQFKSVLSQAPGHIVLLPVEPKAGEHHASEYIYEPDRDSLLDKLVSLYIDNTVYSTLLEAKTGEHSARMTAMTAATDNTNELIAELSLKLNHARQSAITTEIAEISGGAAALAQK